MEIWKSVIGYEGFYEVSNRGRVRSKNRVVNSGTNYNDTVKREGKILKLNLKSHGYLTIMLSVENKTKTLLVHRLVAEAFIENPECKPNINHINNNRSDNRVENLEWVTQLENVQHASNQGRMYCGHRKEIMCIENGKHFASSFKAAEWLNETKFSHSKDIHGMSRNIRACTTGKRPKAYGYRWKDVV